MRRQPLAESRAIADHPTWRGELRRVFVRNMGLVRFGSFLEIARRFPSASHPSPPSRCVRLSVLCCVSRCSVSQPPRAEETRQAALEPR